MKKDWEKGELITAEFFGFKLTSGSGRGLDKGDSKDDDWRADTKTFLTKSYGVNYEDFRLWRRNAIRLGQNFFLHLIPNDDGRLLLEDSMVVVSAKLFRELIRNQKE